MPTKDPKVDSYIEKAAPFARPILRKVRALFHRACPNVEEKIKWGCPSFECNGMLGGMAAFKNHATFGLWRQDVLPDPHGLFHSKSPMGSGKITDVKQLPADRLLLSYIRAAVKLNEEGPPARVKSKPKPPPRTPSDLAAALKNHKKASEIFSSFSPSCKREYIEWITEAKRSETRAKRVATTVEWLAQGKQRNWKYKNC